MGLSEDVVAKLVTSPRLQLFDRLTKEIDIDPKLAGEVLARRFTSLARKGLDPGVLTDDLVTDVFVAYRDGNLAREGIVPVMEWLIQRAGEQNADATAAMEALGFEALDRDVLLGVISDEVKGFDVASMRKPEAAHLYLMGVLMKKLTGKAEGARVARHLEARLKSASGV